MNNNNRRDINKNGGKNDNNFLRNFFRQLKEDFTSGLQAIKSSFRRTDADIITETPSENNYLEKPLQKKQEISVLNVPMFKKRTKERSFLVSALLTSVFIFALALIS